MTSRKSRIQERLTGLIGLRLFKSWNIFATRVFYFARPGVLPLQEEYRLAIECPWRIEGDDQIEVGSEDYCMPASDNLDPEWDPNSQVGNLQDEKLQKLFGETKQG